MPSSNEKSPGIPIQTALETLAEIERTLYQMLFLAELSAGDAEVDRESLQKTLERLRDKIDRAANQLENTPPR